MATACKQYVLFLLILNTVFWLISNLLRTECILSTESKEEAIVTHDETQIIRELKSKISQLENQLLDQKENNQFNDGYNKFIPTNSTLSPKKSIVFVTDIASFIGYHITLKLISMNIKVLGFDDLDPIDDISYKFERIKQLKKSNFNHNILDIIYGNTTDHQHLNYIFNRFQITHILYLVSCHHDSESLITLLQSMLSVYPHYKNIPFIYGSQHNNIDSFIHSVNDVVARHYHDSYNIGITVLRFHSVYGPYHYTFIKQILDNKQSKLDHIYISDAVDGILNALNKGYKYAVFDLAKGQQISQDELLKEMQQHTTHLNDVYINDVYIKQEIIDISLAQKYLNYSTNIDVTTGIKHFMQWYNDDLYERDKYINNRKRNLMLNCFMDPHKVPNLTNYWNKYRQNQRVENIHSVDIYYSSLQEAVYNKNDLKYLIDIVIFHDGLTWKQQISNPKYNDIVFISIEFDYKYRHFRAYNDARFIWWYRYLNKYKKYYKYVLITDLFDVQFGLDPFHYISNKIGNHAKSVITGTQNTGTTTPMKYRDYLYFTMRKCYNGGIIWYGKHLITEKNLFNPGSGIAGHAQTVLLILQRIVLYEMPYADPMCDANMVQYAKTMHYMNKNRTIHILNTSDWNSPFGAYQKYADRQYVIYHK